VGELRGRDLRLPLLRRRHLRLGEPHHLPELPEADKDEVRQQHGLEEQQHDEDVFLGDARRGVEGHRRVEHERRQLAR
jgi:hypothetical protein